MKDYLPYTNPAEDFDPNIIQLCLTEKLAPAKGAGDKDWVVMQDGVYVLVGETETRYSLKLILNDIDE